MGRIGPQDPMLPMPGPGRCETQHMLPVLRYRPHPTRCTRKKACSRCAMPGHDEASCPELKGAPAPTELHCNLCGESGHSFGSNVCKELGKARKVLTPEPGATWTSKIQAHMIAESSGTSTYQRGHQRRPATRGDLRPLSTTSVGKAVLDSGPMTAASR